MKSTFFYNKITKLPFFILKIDIGDGFQKTIERQLHPKMHLKQKLEMKTFYVITKNFKNVKNEILQF